MPQRVSKNLDSPHGCILDIIYKSVCVAWVAYGEQCCGRDGRPSCQFSCGLRFLAACSEKASQTLVDRVRTLRPHSLAVERRAAALDVNVDRMLIGASLHASKRLRATWPKFSAATLCWRSRATPLLLLALALAAMLNASSTVALSVLVVLPAAFRIWIVAHPTPPSPDEFADTQAEEEPVYSVIVALRGEARVVDQLLSAIERLNYPHEKLDVIIAVEAEDHATRAAITARKHRIPIMIVPVPAVGPATKPKALNVALPFARGTFTVIYDAEDRPERNQLRAALKAFQSGGGDLACVQARLCIDTKTSWLARYFTAEYAGHFDAFLPKLAALGLPFPLGGSSNHFRTATLREVGGWDPHNVTEDADLGMRLARFGLPIGRGAVQHLRRGSRRYRPLARPAGTLVQRLDAPCQEIIFVYVFNSANMHRLFVATRSQQRSSCADVSCTFAMLIDKIPFGKFMSAFAVAIGGKANMGLVHCTCLLLTQSGHLLGFILY